MDKNLERIADAIKELSIETGKPVEIITSALSDHGVLTLEQDLKLHESFE